MDAYDAVFSANLLLNEQIACRVFEALPERGPLIVVLDPTGRCWSSDHDEFTKLNLSEALLNDLRSKVDDGAEPVFTSVGDTSVTVMQLATESTNCGYLLVAVPHCNTEPTQAHLGLAESLLGQIALVADLIERNNRLEEVHRRYVSACDVSEVSVN